MAYNSHIETLKKVLKAYKIKTVLELGTGDYSTPILQNYNTIHYDNNATWLSKFGTGDNYILVDDWYNIKFPECDLAFIDFAPGEPRGAIVNKLADIAKIIVVHDTEETVQPTAFNYGYDFSGFKYIKHFDVLCPHTTVLSNHYELENI